jgi:hypothetical protein
MSLSRALLVPRLALLKQPRGLGTSSVLRSGTEYWWGPEQAAGREEVGYGVNGDPVSWRRGEIGGIRVG